MRAINTADGSQKWATAVGGSIKSSPAVNVVLGALYFGSDDGHVYALKESDGTMFWQAPFMAGGAITSSPALTFIVSLPVLVIGSSDGKLYLLDATTGMEAGTSFKTGGSIRSSPTVDGNGNIVVGSDDLKIYSFNTG